MAQRAQSASAQPLEPEPVAEPIQQSEDTIAEGPIENYRGRGIQRQADGSVLAETMTGWRRFGSLRELDAYIG